MFSKFHKLFDALTKVERQVFQAALIVFVISGLASGVNAFYQETTLSPVAGGIYREGIVGQPIAVNPLIPSGEADRDLLALTFSKLSALTEEIKPSSDNRTWTVRLKGDLAWSDGEPITADDVVFTVETIQSADTHSPFAATWQGVGVERLSEQAVRFTVKAPYAFFGDNVGELIVAPEHIFRDVPPANLRLSDYNLEPVGSGPYVFVRYDRRKDGFIREYELAPNPHFAGAPVLIKNFRVKFYPNFDDAMTAFNRREIEGLGGLSSDVIDDLLVSHQLFEGELPRYYALFMNPPVAPALKSTEVREALDLATDRESIVEESLGGHGVRIYGPIFPGLEGYDPAVETLRPFSLEAARELLEKNGWIAGEDGVRVKKVGKDTLKLSFEVVVPDIGFLRRTADALAAAYREIGVELIPSMVSPGETLVESVKDRSYEMILFGNVLRKNPDVFSFWHSSERFQPGLNLAAYDSKTVDALLESIRTSFSKEARGKDIQKLQKTIVGDAPAVFLLSPNYLYAAPKNLGGFSSGGMVSPPDRFLGVGEWYLKTARVFK